MTKTENPGSRFVSPVMAFDDSRWVRPGELLCTVEGVRFLRESLRDWGGQPYAPGKNFQPGTDWRQAAGAPMYGDVNARLERGGANVRLWVGFSDADARTLVEQNPENFRHNQVFVGEDFYHGGPGGPPTTATGPSPGDLESRAGDQQADIAVLDSGLPAGWKELMGALSSSVTLPNGGADQIDPLDENADDRLDGQAGHGIFICGLIARLGAGLDIDLHRVLHSTGEGDEALIVATLLPLVSSPVSVISLSFGADIPDDETSLLGDTIRTLHAAGKVIVAAAGNNGGRTLFPARMDEVLAVGAYDSRQPDAPWSLSCRADVYAPGVELVSTFLDWAGHADALNFAGWAYWTGTSFATPVVAARLAQEMLDKDPSLSQKAVDSWLASLDAMAWPSKRTDRAARRYDPGTDLTSWL